MNNLWTSVLCEIIHFHPSHPPPPPPSYFFPFTFLYWCMLLAWLATWIFTKRIPMWVYYKCKQVVRTASVFTFIVYSQRYAFCKDYSFPISSDIFLSTLFSRILNLCPSTCVRYDVLSFYFPEWNYAVLSASTVMIMELYILSCLGLWYMSVPLYLVPHWKKLNLPLCASWRKIDGGNLAPLILNICGRWIWVDGFMLLSP
jgi:hypothetical protein